jgi:hypothetical protein
MSKINEVLGFLAGIVFILVLNLIVISIAYPIFTANLIRHDGYKMNLYEQILFIAFPFISIFQIIYAVPILGILRLINQPEIFKGVLIGVVITFLLNCACYVSFFAGAF